MKSSRAFTNASGCSSGTQCAVPGMITPFDALGHLAHHRLDQRAGGALLTADGEHRDRQLAGGRQRGAVVLGVLVERAVELEAGAHRAGLLVGGGEGVEVERGRVARARIEEEAQVLALAPGDEVLGQVAHGVEGEVPYARVGAQRVEDGRARQRRVDDDELGHLVAVGLRVGVGDHQADVVADERDGRGDPEVLAQKDAQIARDRALVVAAGRAPRVPRAAVVGRDDAVAGRDERFDHLAPFPPGLGEAVDQQDRFLAFARGHVVQAQARFDVGHPVVHGGESGTLET